MSELTTFERVGVIALAILFVLMIIRSGVKTEDLALYIASGFLYEIVWVVFCGIVITAIHYVTFAPNMHLRSDAEFINTMHYGELFINGIFAVLPMIVDAFMLGKSAGVGFIATVSLGYYTYYLAML